jgi:malate dehydrogenase
MVKTVVVTGGAGRIAYSLIPQLCDGSIFGESLINLRLLDIPIAAGKLEGVKMEVADSCYDRVNSIVVSTDPKIAFEGANIVIILGGFPRAPGMERKDLIGINAEGMKVQAEALNKYADRDCKVLVVANPCNTNCLVMMKTATNLNPDNFSCLTRLDQERLAGFILETANAGKSDNSKMYTQDVRNAIIWGNHSNTQVPDVSNVEVCVRGDVRSNPTGTWTKATEVMDSDFLYSDLIPKVQQRGAEVMSAQGASSGMSAANAIARHMKDWLGIGVGRKRGISDMGVTVKPEQNIFSMAIRSDGNPYGVPAGLFFSFPCTYNFSTHTVEIVPGLPINDRIKGLIDLSVEELVAERADAEGYVGPLH